MKQKRYEKFLRILLLGGILSHHMTTAARAARAMASRSRARASHSGSPAAAMALSLSPAQSEKGPGYRETRTDFVQ